MPSLPVTAAEIAVALVLAVLGSTLQGSVGFGFAVVAAPILLLINPVWVPGPTLLAAVLLVVLIAHRDREHIIRRDVGLGIAGRLIGTVPAAYLLGVLPGRGYDLAFAAIVLVGVVLSASGWHIARTRANVVAAAVLSGVAGTISSIGGPPMALVYQHERGPSARGTMSAIFIVGAIFSVIGLLWAGKFGAVEFALGLILMPGVYVGFRLSRYTTAWLDARHTRPAVLAVSALSALVILVRSLF